MTYVDYEYYYSIYGESGINEAEFSRVLWDAEREIDKATSGVDYVKKLRVAFPKTENDAETVRRCVCELVNFLYKIEEAEKNAFLGHQYIERPDGSMQGRIITSVSAGNESVSYGNASENIISKALKSVEEREKVIYSFVSSRLRGVPDANGVNLLYNGVYPY